MMKWLAILFSLLIILIIVLADMGALPQFLQVWKDLPYGDKVGHFILYGILTLLVDLALDPRGHQALADVDAQRVHARLGLHLLELVGLQREPLGAAARAHQGERGQQHGPAAERPGCALGSISSWGGCAHRFGG